MPEMPIFKTKILNEKGKENCLTTALRLRGPSEEDLNT